MTELNRLYKIAFGLALFTITYNIVEGLISTYLGYEDESLALFGFGSDSFIEAVGERRLRRRPRRGSGNREAHPDHAAPRHETPQRTRDQR